jgi:hypothetical protein
LIRNEEIAAEKDGEVDINRDTNRRREWETKREIVIL